VLERKSARNEKKIRRREELGRTEGKVEKERVGNGEGTEKRTSAKETFKIRNKVVKRPRKVRRRRERRKVKDENKVKRRRKRKKDTGRIDAKRKTVTEEIMKSREDLAGKAETFVILNFQDIFRTEFKKRQNIQPQRHLPHN